MKYTLWFLFLFTFHNVSSTALRRVNRGSFKLKLSNALLVTTGDAVLVNCLTQKNFNHVRVTRLSGFIKNLVSSHVSKCCLATVFGFKIEYTNLKKFGRKSSWSVNVELTVHTTVDRLRSVPNCMRRIPTCRHFLAEVKSQEPRCEVLNCNDVFRLNRDLWNCVRPRTTRPTTRATKKPTTECATTKATAAAASLSTTQSTTNAPTSPESTATTTQQLITEATIERTTTVVEQTVANETPAPTTGPAQIETAATTDTQNVERTTQPAQELTTEAIAAPEN